MTDHTCTEKETLEAIKLTLAAMQESQILMHKKLFESNGERALVEVIRENTEWRLKMDGLFKKAVAGLIALTLGGHGLQALSDFILK